MEANLQGYQIVLTLTVRVQKLFLKNFWGVKPKKVFLKFIMNCIMILLTKLYISSKSEKSDTEDKESSITKVASKL